MDRGPDEAEALVAGPREAAEERKASEAGLICAPFNLIVLYPMKI